MTRQIYEGNQQARLHMAQEVRRLNCETSRLTEEEKGWLPIEEAIGLPAGDNTENDAFEALLTDEVSEQLRILLPDRYLDVLKMRYGEGLTDEESGNRMGVTRSRISAIEQQAKRLLRENPNFNEYKSFL